MLKESSFYLLSSFVTILVNFISLPFFTSYLSPSDYGLVALFILFGNITANIVSFGLQSAAYRFYFKYSHSDFKIINTTIIVFLGLTFSITGIVFVYPFSEWISDFIFNNELNGDLLKWAFLNGCLNYIFIYFSHMLAVQKRAKRAAITAMSYVIINVVLTTYFILGQSLTYLAPIYAIFITNIIHVAIQVYSNLNILGFSISFRRLRESILFSYPEVPGILIGLAYSSFDKGMLNKYKGLESVGYYEFATKFASLQKIFMDAISKSWAPYFFENAEKKSAEGKDAIIKRFYELSSLFIFFGLGVAYFTEEALVVLTTEAYYAAKYATPMLVFYYMMGILSFLSAQQIMFAEKLIYNIPVSALGVIINISLNIIWIPMYGVIGAAIATAVTSIFTSILLLYLANRAYELPFGIWRLVKLFLIGLIFILLSYPLLFIDDYFLIKIVFKILLLSLFVFVMLHMAYIEKSVIISVYKRAMYFINRTVFSFK